MIFNNQSQISNYLIDISIHEHFGWRRDMDFIYFYTFGKAVMLRKDLLT